MILRKVEVVLYLCGVLAGGEKDLVLDESGSTLSLSWIPKSLSLRGTARSDSWDMVVMSGSSSEKASEVAWAWKTATADGGGVLGVGLGENMSKMGLMRKSRKERKRWNSPTSTEALSTTTCLHLMKTMKQEMARLSGTLHGRSASPFF